MVAPFRRSHPVVHLSLEFGHSVRPADAVYNKENRDRAYVVNWRLPAGAGYTPLTHRRFCAVSQEWPHYEHRLRSSGLGRYRVGLEIDGIQARLTATQAGLGVTGTIFRRRR